MKDSGIEWVGAIPKHWNVTKFKFHFKFGMGITILKEQLTNTGIPVLSATEEYNIFGYYDSPNLILDVGDLVIPARGNSIGFVKIVQEPSVSTQTTIYGKPKTNISTGFVKFFCEGNKQFLFQFDQTAIPQITVGQVQNNVLLLPPLSEQNQIFNELAQKCLCFDELIEKLKRKIDSILEYRQTLISSVVIGKFKISEGMI